MSRAGAVVVVLVLALAAAGTTLGLRLWLAPLVVVTLMVGYGAVVLWRWRSGHVLPVVAPPLACLVVFLGALLFRLVAEARERLRVADVLTQYVPAPVARDLLRRGRRAGLPSGTVTFVFTDIVESTRAWEEAPEAMRAAMRRHDDVVGEV